MNNSLETVNAAATAIVSTESRVQPASSVQKKRWGSCWSVYWCFGPHKQSKRIGHALFVPESTPPGPSAPVNEHSTTVVFPFIAPPSSPASFLQSDPPSATQSPLGLLSLKSLSVDPRSQGVTTSIFTVGPYAYETQLVSPPVFSLFNTEPSTANFTPPPESVQMTTPSSPEVPFAQLLTSSLARARRNSLPNQKFPLSQYEYQPYQVYAGSPGGSVRSPGSTISNSGTSSPFPDKHPAIKFRVGEAPKFVGYEYFTTQKWGSRLGSGSVTPNGWGSRLGSGSLTPNGLGSRLGSGTLTLNDGEPATQVNYLTGAQISEVASLANSDNGSQDEEIVVGHRLSFELTCEDVRKTFDPSLSESTWESAAGDFKENNKNSKKSENSCEYCAAKNSAKICGKSALEGDEKQCHCRCLSATLGSSKEFNFDNTNDSNEEIMDRPSIDHKWWTGEKVVILLVFLPLLGSPLYIHIGIRYGGGGGGGGETIWTSEIKC